MDLGLPMYPEIDRTPIIERFAEEGVEPLYFISAETGEGTEELRNAALKQLKEMEKETEKKL